LTALGYDVDIVLHERLGGRNDEAGSIRRLVLPAALQNALPALSQLHSRRQLIGANVDSRDLAIEDASFMTGNNDPTGLRRFFAAGQP
jgi:hypothetical protein